jgi:urease accessory protein
MIAASLLVLGVMIASTATLPGWASAGLIALFGLFHGNAHGLEAPASNAGLLYGLGFMLSTGLLHVAGLGMGRGAQRVHFQPAIRGAAAMVAVVGGTLLFV